MYQDIAVIGMAGRFPKAADIRSFRELLRKGVDAIGEVPSLRKHKTGLRQDVSYSTQGYLEEIDTFDASLFNITPAEAVMMDPHQRKLLEVAWEAFDHAAIPHHVLKGSDTAVILADNVQSYHDLAVESDPTLITGNTPAMSAGRIARFFGLQGNTLMIDTACSSSLVAIHMAAQELILGNSQLALVGAANIAITPPKTQQADGVGILSEDGQIKAFSVDANGTTAGEAVICVVLKTLKQAQEDGDSILSVIKGSAINQEAHRSSSLSAPSAQAQEEVILKAWKAANIKPESIGYIEAHGTGTPLGDPIEVSALSEAFAKTTKKRQFSALSSVKTNIGHTNFTAGISGFVKAVLSLQNQELYPSLHFHTPNPYIDFLQSPFFVNTELRTWETNEGNPRRAGVNSFGISGTNCHLVLEEPPAKTNSGNEDTVLIPMAANDHDALVRKVRKLSCILAEDQTIALNDLGKTFSEGRDHTGVRMIFEASSLTELRDQLESFEAKDTTDAAETDVWFVLSPDTKVTEDLIQAFRDRFAVFEEAYKACESFIALNTADHQRFAFQYAYYWLLLSIGIKSSKLVGLGIGRQVIKVLKGESNLEAALDEISKCNWDEENIEGRIQKFAQAKLGENSTVLELGPTGAISRLLIGISGIQNVIVLEGADTNKLLNEVIIASYQSGIDLNWKALNLDLDGHFINISEYDFDKTHYWLKTENSPENETLSEVRDWLYEINWKQAEQVDHDIPSVEDAYLLLGYDEQYLNELANELNHANLTPVQVVLGRDNLKATSNRFRMEENEVGWNWLMEEVEVPFKGLIYLDFGYDQQARVASIASGDFFPLTLAKCLHESLQKGGVQWMHVTCEAQQVGTELVKAEAHATVSFVKSLVSEYPECRISSIDFDQFNANLTLKELLHDDLVAFVASRKGARFIPELNPIASNHISCPPIPVQKGGVYLITGGASGVGYAIAKRFAMEQPCHFVITGRSLITKDNINATNETSERWSALEYLKQLGSTVRYHQVDVADHAKMKVVIDEAIQQNGKINGVIHAAGSMLYAPLNEMTTAGYQRTISAKVRGAQVLQGLLNEINFEWCVFFSSLNAIVPQKFTSAYTIANAYLDGLALADRNQTGKFRSINWGAWGETGQGKIDVLTDQSDKPLRAWSTANGIKSFELAMALENRHLIIADINESYFQQNPFFTFKSQIQSKSAVISRSEEVQYQDPESCVLNLWKEVLKIGEIEPEDNFFDLGGHSLLATRLMNRLENALSIRPKFKDLLKYPSLKDFTAFVLSELASGEEITSSSIETREDQDYYPVTPAQRRLWTLMTMDHDAASAYNIVQSYNLSGSFDVEVFSKAVNELAERHEILRTVFKAVDGLPVQKVNGLTNNELIEIKSFPVTSEDQRLREIIKESEVTFDLATSPLLKVKVLDWGKGEYTIILVMHHIISDGWSLQVIRRELQQRYESLLVSGSGGIQNLKIQHKDYTSWLNYLTSENNSQDFWKDQFSDQVPVLDIPQDRPRPGIKTYRGDAISVSSAQAMNNLRELSKNHGTSLYMAALAAFNVLLYRYAGQTDIVLGSVMAGRDHSDLEDQIGFFVNTLPLRVKLDENEGFDAALKRVKELINHVSEHQYYPFDQIVEDLSITRDPSRSPLFDVVFALQDGSTTQTGNESDNALDFSAVQLKETHSKYDLALDLTLEEETLLITTVFNPDLYDRTRIERFVTHYEQLLSEVTREPSCPIKLIPYLTVKEKDELLVEFNRTEITLERPDTLCGLIEEGAQSTPDNIAIDTGKDQITYGQLWEDSDRLASYLIGYFNVRKNDIVAVAVAKSPIYYVSILGVMKTGASFLPIDPEHPDERIAQVLTDAEAVVTIIDGCIIDVPEIQMMAISEVELNSIDKRPLPDIEPNDPAYVLYTSGSTGKPKGVVVPHRAITNTIKSQIQELEITQSDHVLQFAATTFDPSIYEIGMALCSGAALIIPDKTTIHDPERFTQFLKDQQVSIAVLPPTYLQLLDRRALQVLRVLVTGGDTPVTDTVYDLARHMKYYNAYGPTECSVLVSYHQVDPGKPKSDRIPIGKPIANTQFYVLDKHQQLLPKGISGELFVSGKGLAHGYLNRNELTNQIFVANPFITGSRMYKTGDRVVWTEEGELVFLGRNDNQVKWRGFRIELGEVKANVDSCEIVTTSEVKLMADPSQDQHLVVFAVLKKGADKRDLENHLRSKLPHYMNPSRIVVVDEIPLNTHGKVDWKAMPSPFEISTDREMPHEMNGCMTELADIWKDVLQINHASPEDNLFECGGNSLKVIKLISRISEQFSRKLEVQEIFKHPTLSQMSELLSGKEEIEHRRIRQLEDQDHYPISHAQKRLWILHQMGIDPAAYNLLSAYRLSGELNVQQLEKAFRLAIERHDALRTIFIETGGGARQKVLIPDQISLDLKFFDLSERSGDAIDHVISEQSEIPFDLQHQIPLRLLVMKVEDDEHILLLIMHHIAADGWSMEVLASEVLTYYNRLAAGEDLVPEPLPLQYKDVTAWQHERFQGDELKKLKGYWLDHFEGDIPVLNLPLDARRPEKRSLQGAQFQTVLSRKLTNELRDFKQAKGYSSFTLAMTAITVLLHRYSHQEDMVIGTVMAGRDHKDLEGQIGYYLNTVAMRFDVKSDLKLSDQCAVVHRIIASAQDHQAYPFDQLLEDLAIPRKSNRTPLFDVLVNFQNTEANVEGDQELDGLRSDSYALDANTTKYDLTFLFSESDEVISFMTLYNSQIFYESTIKEIHNQLKLIMEELAKGGDSSIDEIDFNSDGLTSEKELAMNFDF